MQGTQLKKSWQRWLQSSCTWYRAGRNHETAQDDCGVCISQSASSRYENYLIRDLNFQVLSELREWSVLNMAMAVRSGHGQLAGQYWIKMIRWLVTCDVQASQLHEQNWQNEQNEQNKKKPDHDVLDAFSHPHICPLRHDSLKSGGSCVQLTRQIFMQTLIMLWSLVSALDVCRRYPHGVFSVHFYTEADCVALGHRLKMTMILCRRPKSSERIMMHPVLKLAIFICATSYTQFSSWESRASSLNKESDVQVQAK